MNFLLAIFTIISLSSSVFSDREQTLDTIRQNFANQTKIDEVYVPTLRKMTSYKYEKTPCFMGMHRHAELVRRDLKLIVVKSEITMGDFNDNTGYRIILDDSTTVDVPALLKCIPKFKNGQPVLHEGKQFVAYLLLYSNGVGFEFEKVYPIEMVENDRPVFILSTGKVINNVLKTYKNHHTRKSVKNWFRNANNQSNGHKECEKISTVGITKNEANCKSEILNGTIKVDTSILRVTNTIQVQLVGVIKCHIKYMETSDNGDIIEIKRKFFTISKLETKGPQKTLYTNYVRIWGPERNDNKPRIFSLTNALVKN